MTTTSSVSHQIIAQVRGERFEAENITAKISFNQSESIKTNPPGVSWS